jgi:Ca2+-binding RTX toxin-like protein
MDDDEPTGSVDTEVSVSVGSSVTGEIEVEGDVDYIAVDLIAGVTYQIDMEGQYTAAGTLGDPLLLGIFDGNNTRVAAANDDGGVTTNSRILFTPTTSGTYYISVSHFDNSGAVDTGTYTLFVAEEALSDRPDPISIVSVPNTGDHLIDGLTSSQVYGPDDDGITRVTYSYPQEGALFVDSFDLDDGGPDLTQSLVPASAEAIAVFEAGLAQVASVANVIFTEVAEEGTTFGTLRLSGNDAASGNVLGVAGLPGRFPTAGDIFLFEDFIGQNGSLSFVALHELGHALGLTHFQEGTFPDAFAGAEFTLLTPSFQSAFFPDANSATLYPTSFAYADILALRQLYGADANANGGDNVYTFDLGTRYWETIFDLGGTDTILITGSGTNVSIDLTPDSNALNGAFINIGTRVSYLDGDVTLGTRTDTVFISPETVIENIIAADGDDLVVGNSANNRIEGGAGNDSLTGADGNDTLRGDDGDDLIIGSNGTDIVVGGQGQDTLSGGTGNDQIYAGPGDTGNDILVGGAGDDVLGGGSGNDFIIGGGQSGTINGLDNTGSAITDGGQDTLYGGSGNDTLVSGSFDDTDGDGIFDVGEAVQSSTDNNVAFAGTGDDLVYGAGGADILGGGTGDDTLDGGDGDDTFYGGAGDTGGSGMNDVIFGGGGNDLVTAGGGNDSIDGGDGNDTIFGGTGNDTISGGSGADEIYNSAGNDSVNGDDGDDTLRGNGGDDTLSGGSGNDTFIFRAGDGDDIITDFSVGEDVLRISATATDFSDLASVQAAANLVTIDGQSGVLIDTGDGDSIFIAGISLAALTEVDFIFS